MKKQFANLFFASLFLLGTVSFYSCNNGCTADEISDAANEITTAATAYGNDPSTANCEAYRDALNAYIDQLGDCDEVSQATLDTYQQQADDLDCM